MKLFNLTTFVMAALTFVACDDTTDTIGSSITNRVDNLTITDSAFNVTTRSIEAGAVFSKSNTGIIGKVRDPETGSYLSANYMTQMAPLSSFDLDTLQYIKNANDGKIMADSCFLLVSYQSTYGDTLAPMKVTAYEMSKPMPETKNYYSDFDPMEAGYVSEDNMHATASYTLAPSAGRFKIYLNKPYSKDGKVYNNYGTYIMQMFVEHPEYFKSNYTFLNKVCPGFFIKHTGGIGNVADIWNTELQFYWTRKKTIKASDGVTDSTAVGYGFNRIDGTEEVLQTNQIINDQKTIQQLANDETCTYIKSPAGLYTEATLPVEEILNGHDKDTLNTAMVIFPRINNSEASDYAFNVPNYILMVQKDSLQSFFEKGKIIDNRTSFYASYNAVNKNAYTFTNISNMVSAMNKNKGKSEDWNKVVLVPITLSTVTEGTSTVVSKITHNMTLTSTKLMKGVDTYETDSKGKRIPSSPIQIKVIYSKFKDK